MPPWIGVGSSVTAIVVLDYPEYAEVSTFPYAPASNMRLTSGIGCQSEKQSLCRSEHPTYNSRMLTLCVMPLALVLATMAAVQTISFPTEDGGRVCADLYGQGTRAVVLAHGGRFNKESWRDQAQALASEGFQVLAIDFRGFGCSTGPGQADFDNAPFENDVLAAVRLLESARRQNGFGGWRELSAAELPAMHRSSPRRGKSIVSYFSAPRRTSPRKS